MKRMLVGILVLSLSSLLGTGCGGGKGSGTNKDDGGDAAIPTVVRGGNYTLTDLGTRGLDVQPVGFTVGGAIAGNILKQERNYFYFGNFLAEAKSDLSGGTIRDVSPKGYETDEAYLRMNGVNSSGQAVGTVFRRNGETGGAALWSLPQGADAAVTLLTRPPASFETKPQPLASAEAISDNGSIAGVDSYSTTSSDERAMLFVIEGGVYQNPLLGTLGVGIVPKDTFPAGIPDEFPGPRVISPQHINEAGMVAGTLNYTPGIIVGLQRNNYARAIRYENQQFTDLGVPSGYTDSRAWGANDRGQIIGEAQVIKLDDYYSQFSEGKGFVWANGQFTMLGALDGAAGLRPLAINNNGVIVGATYTGDASLNNIATQFQRGFLWRDGTLVDLNTRIAPNSGWTITKAVDVADDGRIAAAATIGGKSHVVLLTPR